MVNRMVTFSGDQRFVNRVESGASFLRGKGL